MTDHIQSIDRSYGLNAGAQQRNSVLRNTYWLLALSLVPTVLGAWLGVATGITQSLGGTIELVNRETHGHVQGLDATVRLPLAAT